MISRQTWIAVPTYWTFPDGEEGVEKTVFDHPTPLNEPGTLARTLESFRKLDGDFKVLIVAAGTNPDIGADIHESVASLIQPFAKDFPLYFVSPINLSVLNEILPEQILKLDSYGNIRNVQLALPYLAGADVVIGIDDDEVIDDAGYLEKITSIVGGTVDGEFVAGIAGPYFDRNGEYLILGAEKLGKLENIFIKKNYFMNEALKKVMAYAGKKTAVKSNVAFGGNMAMSRKTIARVCHDPYIPRGEDYDYVINAAMAGLFYYFLPDANIIHLPPDSTGSQAADTTSKLLADIRRFIYMREKLDLHRETHPEEAFDLGYLQPYPGAYLDPAVDLHAHAVSAIREKAANAVTDPDAFVEDAEHTARVRAAEFFEYRDTWMEAMKALDQQTDAAGTADSFRVEK